MKVHDQMLRSLLVLALALQAPAARRASTPTAPGSTCVSSSRSARGRPARRPSSSRAHTSEHQLAAAGVTVADQAWDDRTPLGTVRMVNLIATIPGASKDRLVIAGPLRHEALPRVPLRRRQRRRFERRVPDRARAGAEGPEESRSRSSCCFSTARKRWSSGRATTTPTAAATTSRRAKRDGSLASLKAMILVDMIGRPRSADQARRELDDLADGHHLGRGPAREARAYFPAESTQIEDDHLPFLAGGRPRRGHHRSRLPRLAHGRRHAGRRQRPQPAGRRRRPSGRPSRKSKRGSSSK